MRWFIYIQYFMMLVVFAFIAWRGRELAIFSDPNFVGAFWMTVFVALGVAVINLIVGNYVGYYLANMKGQGLTFLDVCLQLPLIVPLIVIATGLDVWFIRLDLIETVFGVVLIQLLPTLPYSIRIARNAYAALDSDINQYVQLMGGTRKILIVDIYLPLLRRTNETILLFAVVISISQYAITSMIGGGIIQTIALILFPYFSSSQLQLVAAAALCIIGMTYGMLLIFRWAYIGVIKLVRMIDG
ncbi:ABC transporter permease subunit [Listeria booriae]|uniref:ABC transporter permease subunit n=1 Tax=Listeria booriae TaxID=1552123 RepID=A0A841Y8G6_9LIST|nr:ABC transporter permease subunit [Listeria booriae]MBC1371962.1 ABC transporter permease subunit [Listeria booriae]